MAKTVFDVLDEKYDEHIRSAMEFIADGGCKDFPHYKNLCGLIQGLNVAKRELNDLMRNFMDEDND